MTARSNESQLENVFVLILMQCWNTRFANRSCVKEHTSSVCGAYSFRIGHIKWLQALRNEYRSGLRDMENVFVYHLFICIVRCSGLTLLAGPLLTTFDVQ